ncbi:hypothetical protein FYK55_10215 [Roseiconus nitratireducens]|uniref:Helix-turn-helix protein n=1 Tax=Roseiconus nitratireducens TaxID=2605748 RepID=A0A5M6DB05_9BACT|nr:hypothetical protein [Roseiconus nitratireducens]KAA5543580.1 hypothetical protein FYK55_10215 [Roseiconus nitratireducens]
MTKRKSQRRFEQLNRIVDVIAPTLPTSTHVAVLLVCFRHARQGGAFQVSTRRIADAVNIKRRRAQYVLDELIELGVVAITEEHKGPIPRKHRITGEVANENTRPPI